MAAETFKNKDKNEAPNLQDGPKKKKDLTTREQPNATDAEKSVISCMLRFQDECIGQALEERVTSDVFYVPAHATLFKLALEFYEKKTPINLVSFSQALEDRGELENIGGQSALADIFIFASNRAHFQHHLELVKDKNTLRRVVRTCTDAISRAFEDPENVPELLDQVEAEVLQIREGTEVEKAITVKQAVGEVFEMLERAMAGEKATQGIQTSYADLDKMSGGLKPGEMFIIAARPSMGKTSFVMNIVEHIALDQKLPCMVFSLEMSTQQIVQRLLFARAKFPFAKLQKGFKPNKLEIANIMRATEEISNSKLFIDDTPSISINELRAKARRKYKDEGIKLIAIDYLQLMKSTSKQAQNSREREVAEISAGLKGLAKELNIPVIVLAQLNRGPEQRGGVPRMSDLRESGSIEQDADLVGLLYRTAYYAETQEAEFSNGISCQ